MKIGVEKLVRFFEDYFDEINKLPDAEERISKKEALLRFQECVRDAMDSEIKELRAGIESKK